MVPRCLKLLTVQCGPHGQLAHGAAAESAAAKPVALPLSPALSPARRGAAPRLDGPLGGSDDDTGMRHPRCVPALSRGMGELGKNNQEDFERGVMKRTGHRASSDEVLRA